MSSNAIATIDKFLSARDAVIQSTLPASMKITPERIRKIVLAACSANPVLATCTPESIFMAVHKSVQLGLEPGSPLGHAYLVPFKNKGVYEATFIMGYKGLIALARRSGEIESVSARVVRKGDKFHVAYGLDEKVEHIPDLNATGEATHYYAVIRYKGGGQSFEVMTKAQVDKIRSRSRASESGPWVTDYDAMALKTAIKQAMRTAPLTVDLSDAIEADTQAELVDVTPSKPTLTALPTPAPMEGIETEGAAREMEAVAPVVAAKKTDKAAPQSNGEYELLSDAIRDSEGDEDLKVVRENIERAKPRLSPEHYATLVQKAGGK